MITGRKFEQLMMSVTGRGQADVDMRGRMLRGVRMWPNGARGLNTPKLGVDQIVTGLLATAGSEKPSQAAGAALEFSNLVEVGDPEPDTLGYVLEQILAKPERAAEVAEVRLHLTRVCGEIYYRDAAQPVRQFVPREAVESFEAGPRGRGYEISSSASIGGALLEQIAVTLVLPTQGEDVPPGYELVLTETGVKLQPKASVKSKKSREDA